MSLRDQAHTILTAGAIEVAPLVDPVNRGRSSRAGQVAAQVVRRLSMLLGNALVREMEGAGLRALLALVSSPRWVEDLGSRRAIEVAFNIRAAREPERIAQWAQPIGMDGGNDDVLRGVPGGDGSRVARLYRDAAVSGGRSDLVDGWAFKKLAQASRGFARPAISFLAHIDAMDVADRTVTVNQGVAAVRSAYWTELQWLSTLDGAQFSRDAQAEVLPVQVPEIAQIAPRPRLDLSGAFRVRRPGFSTLPINIGPALNDGASGRSQEAPDLNLGEDNTSGGDAEKATPPKKNKKRTWVPWAVGAGVTIGLGALVAAMGA